MRFSELLENNPDYFILALKEGNINIDEAIQTVEGIKDKIPSYPKLVYEILIYSRDKNYSNCAILSKFLNIDTEHCREILCNDYVKFEFPVVLNGKACLAHGIAVKTGKLFTNVQAVSTHVEKICRILKENLSVFFDTDIVEDSFMLPLYIALKCKKHDKPWVFTGGLEENLNIKPPAFVQLKEEACKKSGKILFTQRDFSNAIEVLDFLTKENHEVPFLASFSDKRSTEYLEHSFQKLISKVENHSKREVFEKISGAPLLYQSSSLRKKDFVKQARRIHEIIDAIICNGGIPHISLLAPASLAMGIGIMLGSQNPVVLYHYQGNEYHKVIDLRKDIRTIKKLKDINSFKKIYFEQSGDGKNCAFIIQFASHAPSADAEEFIRQKKLNAVVIKIFHKNLGEIATGDWTDEVNELMSLTQFVKTKRHFERFHFFLSVPVPIAFAFGMALGHFSSGSIYQYNGKYNNSYFEALRIEELWI